jgi:hypothetical protein
MISCVILSNITLWVAQMAVTFREYLLDFKDKSVAQGFPYTFARLFNVLPGSIGNTLDTFLGLNGRLGGDSDNFMHGPIGLILGTPFHLLGWALGVVLEVICRAPSYFGYWVIDKPITFLMRQMFQQVVEHPEAGLDHWMLTNGNWRLGVVGMLFYSYPTGQAMPKQIRGLFGFAFGILPALLQVVVNRSAALVVTLIKYPVDHINAGVRYIYAGIGSGLQSFGNLFRSNTDAGIEVPKSQLEEDAPTTPPPAKEPSRFKREQDPIEEFYTKYPALKKAIENKTNYFEVLNITAGDYLSGGNKVFDAAYRAAALKYNPDRAKTDEEKEANRPKWDVLTEGRTILNDQKAGLAYIKECRRIYGLFENTNGSVSRPVSDAKPANEETKIANPTTPGTHYGSNDLDAEPKPVKFVRTNRR